MVAEWLRVVEPGYQRLHHRLLQVLEIEMEQALLQVMKIQIHLLHAHHR
jgi:hypothetical protein